MSKVKLSAAPKISAGESIELTPLIGKVVAVRVIERHEKETKFGNRQMAVTQIVVEGEKEPLEGVLFQSYFQKLKIGEWYVGKVVKTDRAWGLENEGVAVKQIAALEKLIDALPEVPF